LTAGIDATSGTRTTIAEKAAAEEKERQRKAAAEEEAKKVAAEKAAAREKERQRKAAAEEEAKKVAAEKAAAREKERRLKAAAEEEAKKVAAEKAAAEEKERQLKAAAEEELRALAIHFSPTKRPGVDKITHVFLTHNWSDDEDGRNNHSRVSRINKALQRRGFITWFDEEKIDGQIRHEMTEGIKQTHCVVVCITKVYQDKINSGNRADNCYFEFDYASRVRSNHMVPVVMEKCMLSHSAWDHRLDSELGGTLFVDMSKDDEAIFERKCDELATRLNNLIIA
jgi:chemotaxis protein histidine kinase CheA